MRSVCREHTAQVILQMLDEATDPWGIKVERVEVKDVRLPQQLQRAMAAEAEATREARAKVIAAEGEQKASQALKDASDIISESPAALQLRYLQTLTQVRRNVALPYTRFSRTKKSGSSPRSLRRRTPPSSSPCPSTC